MVGCDRFYLMTSASSTVSHHHSLQNEQQQHRRHAFVLLLQRGPVRSRSIYTILNSTILTQFLGCPNLERIRFSDFLLAVALGKRHTQNRCSRIWIYILYIYMYCRKLRDQFQEGSFWSLMAPNTRRTFDLWFVAFSCYADYQFWWRNTAPLFMGSDSEVSVKRGV